MIKFNSNGKLLLTGEYVILSGALALAIPTKYGQSLEVVPNNKNKLFWKSIDEKGNVWFDDAFNLNEIVSSEGSKNNISIRLSQILNTAKKLNGSFLNTKQGYTVTTKLDFPKAWGLGTSSTLINNIAQWANVDAYQLLEQTFGGSGYDIACAKHSTSIIYQLVPDNSLKTSQQTLAPKETSRMITEVDFKPSFKTHLYFVYLNRKQNSRDGIAQYKKQTFNLSETISAISSITEKFMTCTTLDDFMLLIDQHEEIISKVIQQQPVKKQLFEDFKGSIKSLGAWGGDFVLVASKTNPESYFHDKGFKTVIPFKDMIL